MLEAVTEQQRQRFHSHIIRKGADECWEWQGSTKGHGYGQVRIGLRSEGSRSQISTHRLAYALHTREDIPAGLSVLHRCDNVLCCNPGHLFLGTQADNMADMAEKQRSTSAEKNPAAKLSHHDVAGIREMSRGGQHSQRAIAARYGVSQGTVSRIASGRLWSIEDE